jgi:hypothetical protein
MPQPNALRLVVWITLSSSLLGAMFAYAENLPCGIADFVNTELHGVVAGGLNGGILSSFEILVLRGAYGASLRRGARRGGRLAKLKMVPRAANTTTHLLIPEEPASLANLRHLFPAPHREL